MALIVRVENNDASTTYSLGPTLFGSRRTTPPLNGLVTETWTLLIEGAAATIRTSINSLIDLLEQAVEWHSDTTKDDPVWLREVTDGETAKRALIYNYELLPVDGRIGAGSYLLGTAAEWQLAITRGAAWEPVTASFTAGETGGSISLSGGILPTGATSSYQGGTLNGRISKLTIFPTTGGAGTLERCWVGIRPTGTITNPYSHGFNPVVPLEDISGGTADNDIYTDGAIDVVRTRFSDAGGSDDLSRRWKISIGNLGSSAPDDYIGSYVVLLRYQVTVAGTEIGVALSTGYNTSLTGSPTTVNDIQYLQYTGGNYRLIELGSAVIQAQRTPDSLVFYPSQFTFYLDAMRIAGTGHLYSHQFILIPSPHSVFADNIGLTGYTAGVVYIYTDEANKMAGYSLQSLAGPGLQSLSPAPADWEWPKEGGFLVVAGERESSHVLTDTLNSLTVSVYKRWRHYSG